MGSAWFVIDVVSIVPFGEIQKGSGSGVSVKLVRLIKLLRLLKMARVIKLKRFLAAYLCGNRRDRRDFSSMA